MKSVCLPISITKTSALSLERGDVLNAYIFALQFYDQNKMWVNAEGQESFPSTLFGLLSSRPHVCSKAMYKYPDLLDLMVLAVLKAFKDAILRTKENKCDKDIVMFIRTDDEKIPSEVRLPFMLLKSAIVLISKWNDDSASAVKSEFESLSKFIIPATCGRRSIQGAASAIFPASEESAVSVEMVSAA
jgi:hypothetical protein